MIYDLEKILHLIIIRLSISIVRIAIISKIV